jgi:branched-chain amino acid aminotransferase
MPSLIETMPGRTTDKTALHPPRAPAPSRGAAQTSSRALPDWDRLTFSFTETDVIYRSFGDLEREPVWDAGDFLPFGMVTVSPAAAFMSYGIGCFEGLKAQRAADGRVLLFRHRDNARRFKASAERLLMPPFPEDRFASACEGIVSRNIRFVPPTGKGSFYLRPVQHAIEPKLGLGPCSKFWVLVFGCPVGGYFATKANARGPAGVRLRVLEQGRVAPGGTGSAKVMGNYAGGITIATQWKREGFDDVLYLDAQHLNYLTETSGSNIFVRLRGGPVVTPPLDDQILPGITRDSAVRVAREILGCQVEERPITIDELLDEGVEVFCTGTAWTVQHIREIVHHGRAHAFESSELQRALLDEILGIQTGARDDVFGWITEVS